MLCCLEPLHNHTCNPSSIIYSIVDNLPCGFDLLRNTMTNMWTVLMFWILDNGSSATLIIRFVQDWYSFQLHDSYTFCTDCLTDWLVLFPFTLVFTLYKSYTNRNVENNNNDETTLNTNRTALEWQSWCTLIAKAVCLLLWQLSG